MLETKRRACVCAQAFSVTGAKSDIDTIWVHHKGREKVEHTAAWLLLELGGRQQGDGPEQPSRAPSGFITMPVSVHLLEHDIDDDEFIFTSWAASVEGTLLTSLQTCRGSRCFDISEDDLKVQLRLDCLRGEAIHRRTGRMRPRHHGQSQQRQPRHQPAYCHPTPAALPPPLLPQPPPGGGPESACAAGFSTG